jgi:hypothetical protein
LIPIVYFYFSGKVLTFSFSHTFLFILVALHKMKALNLTGVFVRKGKQKRGEMATAKGIG